MVEDAAHSSEVEHGGGVHLALTFGTCGISGLNMTVTIKLG